MLADNRRVRNLLSGSDCVVFERPPYPELEVTMLNTRLGCVPKSLLVLGLLLSGASGARSDDRREARHLLAALHEMREARTELREAKHDFGGHRDKAIKALDYAAEQVETALKSAR